MERRPALHNVAKESAKGCAGGCATHFLIAVAATILIGGGAHLWGISWRVLLFIVLGIIFFVSAFIPWQRER
jgi:type IV secretory pathway VirB2 component (pilin)